MMNNESSAGAASADIRNGVGRLPAGVVPVSVCIVAHNEAAMIGAAIESVAGWAEEVVVVDCESTDDTVAIAERMGARIVRRPNVLPEINKNVSFEHATREWIFSLDADEVLPEESKREITALLAANPTEAGFGMPRRNYYFGAPLMHGGAYPNRQLRLFRRGRGRYPGLGMHERMGVDGAVGELRHPFDHHPYPTFAMWMRKLDFYTAGGAHELEGRGVPITPRSIRQQMVTRPLRRWVERLFLKGGIRDGVPGVVAASSDLITIVMSFARYWMKMNENKKPGKPA